MPYKDPAKERERCYRRYWRDIQLTRSKKNKLARARRQKNKDNPIYMMKERAWARESYYRNREKRLANVKRYRESNREEYDRKKREYFAANPEIRKRAQRNYYLKNKARVFEKQNRRRLKIEASADGSAESFYIFVRSQKYIPCYYCGKRISGSKAHIDHVIAVSKSGNHASSNLCASCPNCNLKKNDKMPSELNFKNQPLLNL